MAQLTMVNPPRKLWKILELLVSVALLCRLLLCCPVLLFYFITGNKTVASRHFSISIILVLHCTTLIYTTLHYTTLHCTTLHYTKLHYTTLHYTTLHYTTLHYTPLSRREESAVQLRGFLSNIKEPPCLCRPCLTGGL